MFQWLSSSNRNPIPICLRIPPQFLVTHYETVLLDANIKLNKLCQEINLCNNKDSNSNSIWTATAKDGSSDSFNAIILTIPVPQILQLAGTFQEHLKSVRPSLELVEYSSRFALALYFSEDAQVEFPWTAKYVKDNQCIRFVAIDSTKRGLGLYYDIEVTFTLRQSETQQT